MFSAKNFFSFLFLSGELSLKSFFPLELVKFERYIRMGGGLFHNQMNANSIANQPNALPNTLIASERWFASDKLKFHH
jgi:hypothetical protein